jgi:hypothetical protein
MQSIVAFVYLVNKKRMLFETALVNRWNERNPSRWRFEKVFATV